MVIPCIPLPVKPPRRTWISQAAAVACFPAVSAVFHSTTMAPADPLRALKTMSEISVAPFSPAFPTVNSQGQSSLQKRDGIKGHLPLKTGTGLAAFAKVAPPPLQTFTRQRETRRQAFRREGLT